MKYSLRSLPLIAAVVLAGCVSVPSGPSVMVLPGEGRSFEQFRADDFDCRNYAYGQVGGTTADQAAADSVARSAVVGTLIGAAAGGAIAGRGGAAAGAGAGLLLGAGAGSSAAQSSAYGLQRRYDYAFQQCMYAKGHHIPSARRAAYSYPVPPGYGPPPPAASNYPPSAASPNYPAPPPPTVPR